MNRAVSFPGAARRNLGWMGVGMIALVYAALYGANYWVPLGNISYTSRIWNWSQTALTVTACLTLIALRALPAYRDVLLGLVMATISGASHGLHDPSLSWSLQEGLAVWVCFVAGAMLFRNLAGNAVVAFRPPLAGLGKSLVFGVLVAVPLAIINNLYFYLNVGSIQFQDGLRSALAALSPAIHEEVIFRYFVLGLVFHLIGSSTSRRMALAVGLVLAVVPHSLNHLPDLFLANPLMGLAMLTVTCLLFGLPMGLLQVKRNLETAMAFHWLIDFVRFLFGF
jgi:hypothetical protein